MNKTKIEWCDSTWNPVTGCLHGCTYCYARRIAERFGQHKEVKGVVELHFKRENPYPYDFYPTLHKYRMEEPSNKNKPQNIFVCSMADLFGNWVSDEWIEEVFRACEAAPQHNYLFLTKNVERYTQYGVPIHLDNMWYGTSITKLHEVSKFNYLPAFCKTFVSIEPIMEDLLPAKHNILFKQVNWVIIGAETGQNKNKVIPKKEWIDDIVYACKEFDVPVFMKDSLVLIMGEENMLREFPEELKKVKR